MFHPAHTSIHCLLMSLAGVPKHHVCNANLMRNGADFSVFVNTAQVRLMAKERRMRKGLLSRTEGLAAPLIFPVTAHKTDSITCLYPPPTIAYVFGRSLTAQTAGRGQMRQSAGARSRSTPSQSRCGESTKPLHFCIPPLTCLRINVHNDLQPIPGLLQPFANNHAFSHVGRPCVYISMQVYADATVMLPLIISQTFAKTWQPKGPEDKAPEY